MWLPQVHTRYKHFLDNVRTTFYLISRNLINKYPFTLLYRYIIYLFFCNNYSTRTSDAIWYFSIPDFTNLVFFNGLVFKNWQIYLLFGIFF